MTVNGAATTIDSANIAWKSDLKYKLGDYAPTNMNTDQATRGGAQITGNVDTDEDFATWMRTAALSKFRKLVGVINVDIVKGDTITFTIQNRYNTYMFNGEKAVVLATKQLDRRTQHHISSPLLFGRQLVLRTRCGQRLLARLRRKIQARVDQRVVYAFVTMFV